MKKIIVLSLLLFLFSCFENKKEEDKTLNSAGLGTGVINLSGNVNTGNIEETFDKNSYLLDNFGGKNLSDRMKKKIDSGEDSLENYLFYIEGLLEPDSSGLIYDENVKEALKTIENLEKKYTNNSELFRLKGFSYSYLKNYDKAIESYEKSLKISKNTNIYSDIGAFYIKLENYEKAKEYLNKSLELASENISSLYSLAKINFLENDYENSLKNFEKIISVGGSRGILSKSYNYIGDIYVKQGNFEKAKENFVKSIEKNPDFIYGYMNIGYLYFLEYKKEIIKPDYTRARAGLLNSESYFKIAIEKNPDLVEANYYLGLISYAFKEEENSNYYFDIALKNMEKDFSVSEKYKKEIEENIKILKNNKKLGK